MGASLDMNLIIGLPGAGKSTYVDAQFLTGGGYDELIRFDELRRAFGHAYHAATEQHVCAVACTMARVAFMRGRGVVVDESVTTPGVAMDLVGVAREYGARVRMLHICAPVDACRASRVPQVMPEADFERKLAEWQMWGKYILSLADVVLHLNNVRNFPS